MKCSRFACFKHIAFALITLTVIVCAMEVGLRVYSTGVLGQSPTGLAGKSLIVRSWQTHHGMKPLSAVNCRHPDTNATLAISTNSFGLRGREPAVPKPLGVFRIICLGDETTLAADVDVSQTFSARLEKLLQPFCRLKLEVVNAGVPGFCPLLSYLQVKHSLLSLQPDLIVLNFDMGDISDDYRYRRHTNMDPWGVPLACPHPAIVASAAADRGSIVDQFLVTRWCKLQLGEIPSEEDRPEDLRNIDSAKARYAWLTDDPPDWSIHVEQALSPIEQLNHLAERHFTRFVVAVYPAPWQVSAVASGGAGVREAVGVPSDTVFRSRVPFDTLKQYVEKRNIAYFDASTSFQSAEHPEKSFLQNAARLSRTGHELYARELARFIFRTVPDVWKRNPSTPKNTEPVRHALSPGKR